MLADRQSQPGATKPARGRSIYLAKRFEQLLHPFGRNADAGILDRKMQPVLLVFQGLPGNGNDHFALVGKLDGIGEQVDQNLSQAGHVAGKSIGYTPLDGISQLEFFLGRFDLQQIKGFFDAAAAG